MLHKKNSWHNQTRRFLPLFVISQKIKEEVTLPKTTKRGRESSAQEPEEPEKVTPKRAKTQVSCLQPERCQKWQWNLKGPACKIWLDL